MGVFRVGVTDTPSRCMACKVIPYHLRCFTCHAFHLRCFTQCVFHSIPVKCFTYSEKLNVSIICWFVDISPSVFFTIGDSPSVFSVKYSTQKLPRMMWVHDLLSKGAWCAIDAKGVDSFAIKGFVLGWHRKMGRLVWKCQTAMLSLFRRSLITC